MNRLENSSLGLPPVLDIQVLNQQHPNETHRHDTSSRRQHPRLRIPIRLLDRGTHRRALRVRELRHDARVDGHGVPLGRLGQEPHQGGEERVCPDGTRDGGADGAADGAEDEDHGDGRGDVLVLDGGQAADLADEDEDGAAHGDEDLAHNKVAYAESWAPEVDHEALGEDVEGDGWVEGPLKFSYFGVMNVNAIALISWESR